MASWFERGRPALFEALNTICNQIDIDIAADLERTAAYTEPSDTVAHYKKLLEQSTTRIAALEAENSRLLSKIDKLTHHHSASSEAGDDNTIVTQPSPPKAINSVISSIQDDVSRLSAPDVAQKLENAKLVRRFRALNDNFHKARDALVRRKKERDAWKKRFEMLERQIHAIDTEHEVEAADQAPEALASLQLNAISGGSSFNVPVHVDTAGSGQPEPYLPVLPPNSSTSARSHDKVLGPLDSTQGESEANELPSHPTTAEESFDVAVKLEPSSDIPFVVSERAVKKRVTAVEQEQRENPASRIKMEPHDSSSPVVANPEYAYSEASIDLGNISHKIMTPRKRINAEHTLAEKPAQMSPHAESASLAAPVLGYVRSDMVTPQTERAHRSSSALTPVNANRRMISPSSAEPNKTTRKRRLRSGIEALAEDDVCYDTGEENMPAKKAHRSTKMAKNRLEQLLHDAEPPNDATINQSSTLDRRSTASPTAGLNIPSRRELPFDKQARQAKKLMLPPPSSAPPAPARRSPQHQSKLSGAALRDKPSRELRLDDFRINPAANGGHDFAYSDVVRDKGGRACLPGCTDMHCCGKQFRALAISQRPNPPLTPAQRLEEQRLLEQYLGDYAYRLATMDNRERADLWIEAKTQELANKYGKHRHRYSRMQSPPGFWDADFPSTQELEAGKEEAAEREKRAIQERYREAMRPGGRWLLKDD